MSALRIFYDGQCPLCRMEIDHLKKLDSSDQLELQDITVSDFSARFPYIDREAADRILHGELADGSMIYGLDVTCTAWQLVGRGHWFGRTDSCDERCRKE